MNPKTVMAAGVMALAIACSDSSPTTPTPPGSPTLTAPSPVRPIDDEQLSTLRPTFTVQNGTSTDTSGSRTYEFQISDRADFTSTTASRVSGFYVVVGRPGIVEVPGGQTTFTPDVDLQPTTRMYWRARMTQGAVTSAWSAPGVFRTKLVGFVRDGELYDPLIHQETVGLRVGSTEFVPGVGLRINSQGAYVRYDLTQTITSGEFSADVSGLAPNGPDHKLKIFSMSDSAGDLFTSAYQVSVMYRGIDGNPPNCVAFKAVFGSGPPIEPNFGEREAGTRYLNPGTTYHWKATWGTEFRVSVREGSLAGPEIYNLGLPANGRVYNPVQHYAYLGSTNAASGLEPGSFPGAVYRNVWIGNRPRPDSLGSALLPR